MKYRPEYDLELIGRNLKRLREAKKLSVDEVREYLRLGSVQAVYKYEKGKSYPPADTMFALMELYEADLQDIVSEPINNIRAIHEESIKLSSVAFRIENHNCELEFINIEEYKEKRFKRLKDYYDKYIELMKTVDAG